MHRFALPNVAFVLALAVSTCSHLAAEEIVPLACVSTCTK